MVDVGWLCFTSHRERGHLETAPLFTVPSKGHEAQFYTPFPSGIEPRVVAWQSIIPLLRHTSSTFIWNTTIIAVSSACCLWCNQGCVKQRMNKSLGRTGK